MEVREWLKENDPPEHMPNIDVLYSAGAERIDLADSDDPEEIVLDITLPDNLEETIDVMIAITYVMQDTSKVKKVSDHVVRMTTGSPYDYFVFDENKLYHEEE